MGISSLTIVNRKLLQANDNVISRGLAPCVFFNQRGPDLLEFAVIKDSLGTALNIDFVSSVYKSFGGGWCEGRAVFKGLAHWRSALATGIAAHQ
jgi:hypothetical protein